MIVFISLFLLLLPMAAFSQHRHHAHVLKGVMTNDSLHCDEIKRTLFQSTAEVDIQRIEWERFLPVFTKTQIRDLQRDRRPSQSGEMEFAFDNEHLRFNLMGPVGPHCKTPLESYGEGDDEKRACGLQQLQKLNQVTSEDGKKHECVIYSIGSNNQWGFEEAILKKTDCRVETFDCTMAKNAQAPAHIAHRVRFHPICLSDADYEVNGRKFVSWPTLNKITGVTTQPSFLKMDVEGYEFPILKSIIDSGVYLPLQIALEVHILWWVNGVLDTRKVSSVELLTYMNYLYKFGGYYLIDRHDNPRCPSCSEIVLAKLTCENYPRPENYKELLLSSESIQHPGYTKAVKQSADARYFG